MVQILAYFKHIQIVRNLEPTKTFDQDYKIIITRFFLAWQLFIYYGTRDVPVNMVAVYWEACTMS